MKRASCASAADSNAMPHAASAAPSRSSAPSGLAEAMQRHGSLFDLRTGKPRTLPAYRPVQTFEVRIDHDEVKLEL